MNGYQPKEEKWCWNCAKGVSSPFCSIATGVCDDWKPAPPSPPMGGSSVAHEKKEQTALDVRQSGRQFLEITKSIRGDIAEIVLLTSKLLGEKDLLAERACDAEARIAELGADITKLRALLVKAEEALNGVIRVADRATVEFDTARSVSREIEEVLK